MLTFKKINHQLINNQFLAGLVVFLISLIIFSYLQFYPGINDPDAFYHVKIAQLMSQRGLITDFPWMQFSTWKDGFVDHHFLYHVLLIPFVSFLPPLIGGKIFQIILCSLAVLAFYWMLKKLKIKAAFWFTLVLFLAPSLLFRVSLVKAQPLSLIILFIGLHFIFNKKHFSLFLTSLIYVLSYGGWILLPIFSVLYALVAAFDQALQSLPQLPKSYWRAGWQLLLRSLKNLFSSKLFWPLAAFSGAAAGLIINPFFPQNINFYWVHIFKIGLINYQKYVGVGGEWYPLNFSDLAYHALIPLLLATIGAGLLLFYFRSSRTPAKFFLLSSFLLLLLTLKSQRNIEYLIPFLVASAAGSLNLFWENQQAQNCLLQLAGKLKKLFPEAWVKKTAWSLAIVMLLCLGIFCLVDAKKRLTDTSFSFDYLGGASRYLASHSQPRDLVLNSNWSYFPMLFYHNDKNYYVIGLDPTFMYLYDKNLQKKMIDITLGKRYEEAYGIIKNELRAKYVQVEAKNTLFKSILDNNFKFKKVYEDGEGAIYEVL